MSRSLFMLLLLTLSGISQAAILRVGENLNVLAARHAQVNPLSKWITINAGEQALIVRFDAPANPGSPNESQGRVSSASWLLTFTVPQYGEAVLTTDLPRTENEARKAAENPRFVLSKADGTAIPLTARKLDIPQRTLLTDFSQYLPEVAVAPPPDTANHPEQHASLGQLQREFLQLDASQRKAFLRWALAL